MTMYLGSVAIALLILGVFVVVIPSFDPARAPDREHTQIAVALVLVAITWPFLVAIGFTWLCVKLGVRLGERRQRRAAKMGKATA